LKVLVSLGYLERGSVSTKRMKALGSARAGFKVWLHQLVAGDFALWASMFPCVKGEEPSTHLTGYCKNLR
jgi:hypothetical protein